jgi:hypothetical protein
LTGEFLVPTQTSGDQRSADVGMKPGGDFLVVWQSCCQDGSDEGIFGRSFDASGIPIGGEFQINTYTTGRQSFPVVTLDGEGDSVVIWQSFGQDGSSEGLFAQEFSDDGFRVGGEFQVNTYTTDRQTDAAASSAPDGDFVVAWRRGGLSVALSEVSAQRYAGPGLHLDAEGSCPGSVLLSIVNAPPGSEVAVVAAENSRGFIKGRLLCPGTRLEIGEPFQLPPAFVIVDGEGRGEVELVLGTNRCFVEALALADCQTSGAVSVPVF